MAQRDSGKSTQVHHRRPTLRDVADAAGVSPSTTSRAISGHGYVAADVRRRVLAAADELGYVAHAMARSLRTQSTRIVGVLVSDLQNPFYAELAAGIADRARARNYTMMVIDDAGDEAEEMKAAEAFVAARAAGVLVTPLGSRVVEYLQAQYIPVVELDRQFAPGTCDGVVIDNAGSARRLTELLLRLGHRRVSMFYDESEWTTGEQRISGYRAALVSAGIPEDGSTLVEAGWSMDSARRVAVEQFAGSDRPTAVLAVNNVLAEGVWRAIGELGLSVPGDISIVSFDDARWMSLVEPAITAIAQDAVTLGRTAMEVLLERIGRPDRPARTTVLPAELVIRGSTAEITDPGRPARPRRR